MGQLNYNHNSHAYSIRISRGWWLNVIFFKTQMDLVCSQKWDRLGWNPDSEAKLIYQAIHWDTQNSLGLWTMEQKYPSLSWCLVIRKNRGSCSLRLSMMNPTRHSLWVLELLQTPANIWGHSSFSIFFTLRLWVKRIKVGIWNLWFEQNGHYLWFWRQGRFENQCPNHCFCKCGTWWWWWWFSH